MRDLPEDSQSPSPGNNDATAHGTAPPAESMIQRGENLETMRRLVARAVDGDQQAFAQIYEAHVDRVYRYVAWKVPNASDAEDLVAQVFIHAWKGLPNFRWLDRPFIAWLLRLAQNVVVDHYRQRSVRQPATPLDIHAPDESADPAEAVDRDDRAAEVRAALAYLTEEQQQVLLLRFADELETKEIAATMGKREDAIRALQCRALQALRRQLTCGENNRG